MKSTEAAFAALFYGSEVSALVTYWRAGAVRLEVLTVPAP